MNQLLKQPQLNCLYISFVGVISGATQIQNIHICSHKTNNEKNIHMEIIFRYRRFFICSHKQKHLTETFCLTHCSNVCRSTYFSACVSLIFPHVVSHMYVVFGFFLAGGHIKQNLKIYSKPPGFALFSTNLTKLCLT